MKKKLWLRCLAGAPLGLAISTVITLLISIGIGDGTYYPVVPELVAACGSELNAVLLQSVCSLLYGAAWAGASVIWEYDRWSLLRQTITHLLISSMATFPIAYFMRWMSHSVSGILLYFGAFLGLYLLIWVLQYTAIKKRIRQMNAKMQENKNSPG